MSEGSGSRSESKLQLSGGVKKEGAGLFNWTAPSSTTPCERCSSWKGK